MKRLTLFFALVMMTMSSVSVSAQGKYGADSAECIKYLSYYKEYFKQKTAYEIYRCDWSSDVCSSDLNPRSLGRAQCFCWCFAI